MTGLPSASLSLPASVSVPIAVCMYSTTLQLPGGHQSFQDDVRGSRCHQGQEAMDFEREI